MTASNPASGNNPAMPKTKSELQSDAVFLHAMIQGIEVLYDTIKHDLSPASNAMPAMFESLLERASRLADDLDWVQQ